MRLEGIVIQLLHQPATMDDPDPRRQPIDLTEDVAGHEDRDALVGEATEQLADLDDASRIQPVGRLIEDEQFWRRQQRTSKGQPLQIAERERAGSPIGVWLECQPLDDSIDRGRVGDPGQATGDVEVLADGEFLVRGRRLDEIADAPPQVRGSTVLTRSPNSSACPAVGRIIPSSIRIVVDLPAPLRPRKA